MGGMARKARAERGPGVYHVYARGNDRQAIFLGEHDRLDYLLRLRQVCEELGWRCLAYCLMGNHLHLLIETRRPNLGDGMRRLQGGYAQAFNRRHGRTGHVFGDRYGSVTIADDSHFRRAVRYLARNPLEAGLAKEVGEWPWDNWAPPVPAWRARIIDVGRLRELLHVGDAGTPPGAAAEASLATVARLAGPP
jgi:putative transposase